MQQLSICRAAIELPIGNEHFFDCLRPKQDIFPLVLPRWEYEDASSQAVPAFARGLTVGGLRFSYNYSIYCAQFWDVEADNLGINDVQDQIDIWSALVVLPLQKDSVIAPSADSLPQSLLHINGTQPQTGGTGFFKPRVLYRSLNRLHWIGRNVTVADQDFGASIYRRNSWDSHSSTMRDSQEGTHPVTVKAKVTLGVNEGLFWFVETNFGFAGGEGSTESIAYGMDFFGVAAVKPARTNR